MPWLAAGVLSAFLTLAFPVRALLNGRRGDVGGDQGGGLGWEARRPRSWWLADGLFALGFGGLLSGAMLEATGVLEPVAEPRDGAVIAGLGLSAAATALLVRAQHTMGRAWRPAIAPRHDGRLATSGPFRVVRNPVYVAMLCAAAGCALLAPSVPVLAACPVLALSLMLTARAEEPLLLARFGDEYAAYAGRTGRFVPAVGRLRGRRGA